MTNPISQEKKSCMQTCIEAEGPWGSNTTMAEHTLTTLHNLADLSSTLCILACITCRSQA